MKETAMHVLTAIVFAGVAGLALAALHEPAGKSVGPSVLKIEISGNIKDDNDNIADDWRFSIHESIRAQIRAQLRSRSREGLQISRERIAVATPTEPDPGMSLQAFQPAPVDAERMFSK